MARILVTGASGFIGSYIAKELHNAGHSVLATGRNVERLAALAALGISVQKNDLVADDLRSLVENRDVVVHCAALASPWGHRDVFWTANVVATERLLAECQPATVKRFVHVSSPSIYFRQCDQFNLTEAFDPPRQWINAYAETKWEAEQRVRAATAAGLPSIILRPRAVFGEGDRTIFPRILAIAERGWFPLVGAGRAHIDVTYVGNFMQAVFACLKPEAPLDGRAFNITNGEPLPVRELLRRLFDALNLNVRMVPIPRRAALALGAAAEAIARRRAGQPEPRLSRYGVGILGFSQTLDITAARRQLGYTPNVSVDEGIARFARWWRSDARH